VVRLTSRRFPTACARPARSRPILLDGQALLYRADLPRDTATDDRIWAAFEAARAQLTSKE
jgi:hypothetical protein